MAWLTKLYRENINGIIITLIFHILVFVVLIFSNFRIKREYKEAGIIIDIIPEQVQQDEIKKELNEKKSDEIISNSYKTNIGSNLSATQKNDAFEEAFDNDIEQAQRLVKDVSHQLNRDIPTIDDLKMPEAKEASPDEKKDKVYTGESNIEYFLENRYHIKLPIPVYLAEGGGKVKVDIWVDRKGNVIKAEPEIKPGLSAQILSYAKTAAIRTKFNEDENAKPLQSGYITYNFIPQR